MSTKVTERKYRGIDVAGLKYYVKNDSWPINPDGHLPKFTDALSELVNEFAGEMEKLRTKDITPRDAEKKAKEVNRKILAIALVQKSETVPNGFDFDEVVNKYGWKVIDGMVVDLKIFLADYGGQEEYLLLKQRSSQATQNGLYGLEV